MRKDRGERKEEMGKNPWLCQVLPCEERREKRKRWNEKRELLLCLAFYQLSSFLD